jgi:hypothetical protein
VIRGSQLTVTADALPEDPDERATVLSEHFGDFKVAATRISEGWRLQLRRDLDADFYIDPQLAIGLKWWSFAYSRVAVRDIPFVTWAKERLRLSLNDTWTLLSWSFLLREFQATRCLKSPLTLLHVDDHDDLMSPRLVWEVDHWSDGITRHVVDILKPQTVQRAIKSGSIGIGAFIPLLLHTCSAVNIRHLCASPVSAVGQQRRNRHLRPTFIPDRMLGPDSLRLDLESRVGNAENDDATPGHPYLVTNDLNNWLSGMWSGPVLLHIDMDYFNNRYDGKSDWEQLSSKHDPPLETVLHRIDEVFGALKHSTAVGNIVDMTVALSPGFCPAEFWEPSINRVLHHLGSLGKIGRLDADRA